MTEKKVTRKEIAEAVRSAQKVALFGHVIPDSDSYGSVFGMKLALETMGKTAYTYIDDNIPYFLDFFKNHVTVKAESAVRDADLVLTFDCSQVDRVERADILQEYKKKGVEIYQVDHHQKGNLSKFADYFWIDPEMSSTSQMVLQILKQLKFDIKKDIATLLLAGLEDDTGSFQHQNTTGDSLEDAAFLLEKGARFHSIIENTFNSKKDLGVLKLYGLALERLIYNKKFDTATTYMTLEDLDRLGLKREAYSGIINYLNIIEGAKMIVVISEAPGNVLKVSVRTRDKDVNVQKLASLLGGGGHIKASGFSLNGKIVVENGQPRIV